MAPLPPIIMSLRRTDHKFPSQSAAAFSNPHLRLQVTSGQPVLEAENDADQMSIARSRVEKKRKITSRRCGRSEPAVSRSQRRYWPPPGVQAFGIPFPLGKGSRLDRRNEFQQKHALSIQRVKAWQPRSNDSRRPQGVLSRKPVDSYRSLRSKHPHRQSL
jgi:hypothetical protein